MNKPKRCISPAMKFCQECQYGSVIYPDWVETPEDTYNCTFKTKCVYGLENTEPTEAEIKEFESWVNKIGKGV